MSSDFSDKTGSQGAGAPRNVLHCHSRCIKSHVLFADWERGTSLLTATESQRP